jgi:hypothetical protein
MPIAAQVSKNRGFQEDQEGQEAKFQQLGYDQVQPELFRRIPGSYQRDYYTSANHAMLLAIATNFLTIT